MHSVVAMKRQELSDICRRRGVRKLEVFGSAARDDFDEANSDVDLLVQFDISAFADGGWCTFELQDELERLLGRSVDLISAATIRNPYLRASIDADRQLIYEA